MHFVGEVLAPLAPPRPRTPRHSLSRARVQLVVKKGAPFGIVWRAAHGQLQGVSKQGSLGESGPCRATGAAWLGRRPRPLATPALGGPISGRQPTNQEQMVLPHACWRAACPSGRPPRHSLVA